MAGRRAVCNQLAELIFNEISIGFNPGDRVPQEEAFEMTQRYLDALAPNTYSPGEILKLLESKNQLVKEGDYDYIVTAKPLAG